MNSDRQKMILEIALNSPLSKWYKTNVVIYNTQDELYIKFTEDTMPRCVCGQVIQYQFQIKNIETGECHFVGSECIRYFKTFPNAPRLRVNDLMIEAKQDFLASCPQSEIDKANKRVTELKEIADSKGYKPGWIYYQICNEFHVEIAKIVCQR